MSTTPKPDRPADEDAPDTTAGAEHVESDAATTAEQTDPTTDPGTTSRSGTGTDSTDSTAADSAAARPAASAAQPAPEDDTADREPGLDPNSTPTAAVTVTPDPTPAQAAAPVPAGQSPAPRSTDGPTHGSTTPTPVGAVATEGSDRPADTPAPDTPAPVSPPRATDGSAAPTTPGRGAHLQSRRAPVAPEPEEPVTPRLAGPEDTAPTATMDPLSDPLDRVDPVDAPPTPTAAAGPVRRTSFRAEPETVTLAPDPFSATPPPATPLADSPLADSPLPEPQFTEPQLTGTGPADDQVPPGDASVAAPSARTAPAPTPRRVREPRRGGVGRMLAGMLIGLLAGAAGTWLVVFGQSRILGAQAPAWDASYDPLGVVLVTVGVLLLAALIGVGAWSTAAPFTAGLLTTVIGVVYLYVPATTHADTVRWVATDYTRGSVERTVVAATSGTLFLIGALLLAAGITFVALHRRRFPRA